MTNERRKGLSKASRTPPTAAVTYNASTGGLCMNASAASAKDSAISRLCVMNSRLRLFDRSAIVPAQIDSTRIGPYWHVTRSPTAIPLLVRWRTSRVSATFVSQLPVLDTSCPTKNSRKLRMRSDENVVFASLRIRI